MSFIDKIRESYYKRKVTKEAKSITKDLVKQPDYCPRFISVITSFCARIYGQSRTKRNTEKIISSLGINKDIEK